MLDTNSKILFDIINVVTMYIDWLIFFSVLNAVGNKKISRKKYIPITILILLFMGYLNTSTIFQNTKIILCIITGILFYKISYKDNIYKCIVINLLFWLGLIVIESVSIGIVVIINGLESIDPLLSYNVWRIQAIVISKLLLFIQFAVFKYFRLALEFKPKDLLIIGIPVMANITSLLIIFGYNLSSNISSKINIVVLILITALITTSSIMLILIIGKVVQDDKLKLEYELINERIKTSHKSYENINEIHNKLKYIYHDLKNHMICIKNYSTKEEIINYIDSLDFQISDFERFSNTGNETLDIILGEKKYLCKKHGIIFEENINIRGLGFVQESDICSIFANALDNAIEACIKIDNDIEKTIEVKATYINGFSIIKFTNTKVNDIKFVDDRIQTNKDDKKIHGVGISSIKYVVNKYDGEIIVNYSDNEFILKIMIPIRG